MKCLENAFRLMASSHKKMNKSKEEFRRTDTQLFSLPYCTVTTSIKLQKENETPEQQNDLQTMT